MKRETRVKGEAAALPEDSLSHRFDEKSCGLQRANGIRQADQNGHPTRPQPMATPQAYPLGYVEDVAEVRTPLGTVFSSLLGKMGNEPISDRGGHLAKVVASRELVIGLRQEIEPLRPS